MLEIGWLFSSASRDVASLASIEARGHVRRPIPSHRLALVEQWGNIKSLGCLLKLLHLRFLFHSRKYVNKSRFFQNVKYFSLEFQAIIYNFQMFSRNILNFDLIFA